MNLDTSFVNQESKAMCFIDGQITTGIINVVIFCFVFCALTYI